MCVVECGVDEVKCVVLWYNVSYGLEWGEFVVKWDGLGFCGVM